jgi:hypothetical protein
MRSMNVESASLTRSTGEVRRARCGMQWRWALSVEMWAICRQAMLGELRATRTRASYGAYVTVRGLCKTVAIFSRSRRAESKVWRVLGPTALCCRVRILRVVLRCFFSTRRLGLGRHCPHRPRDSCLLFACASSLLLSVMSLLVNYSYNHLSTLRYF